LYSRKTPFLLDYSFATTSSFYAAPQLRAAPRLALWAVEKRMVVVVIKK